jgi:hypothetical protein
VGGGLLRVRGVVEQQQPAIEVGQLGQHLAGDLLLLGPLGQVQAKVGAQLDQRARNGDR